MCSVQPWIVEGKGAIVKDLDGNEYIDLMGGVGGVANIGHCHPKIVQAIKEQAEKLIFVGEISPHLLRTKLTEKLVEVSPKGLDKVAFGNSGAGSVEKSLYFARSYTKKLEVLAFQGGYHGRSPAASAISCQVVSREERARPLVPKLGLLPLIPGIFFVPYPYCYRCPFGKEYPDCDLQCARYIRSMFEDPGSGITEVGAFVVEIIQNAGGCIIPPKEFWPFIRKVCDENDVPLITDECFTGFGRTGKMFACEHYAIKPEITCVSKGMSGGGMPISAIIGTTDIMSSERSLNLCGSTFSGNLIGFAAALATIEVIQEEGLVNRSAEVGEYFLKRLREIAEGNGLIGDVRGKGLSIGVELVKSRETKRPAREEARRVQSRLLKKKRVILNITGRYNNVLRICPPLVITKELVDDSVERLDEVLTEIERK